MNQDFKFGTCSVPCGTAGMWSISEFTLKPDDCTLHNFRCIRDGNPEQMLFPGTYKRLVHKGRGVIMSNTPMEINTCRAAYRHATGRVFVSGLGMGMVIEAMLSKPDVEHIRVVEIDPDVIRLVAYWYLRDPRLEVIQGDARDYKPAKGEYYDFCWHDIWDTISADNLSESGNLKRKFARRAHEQGVWAETIARREQRRARYG